MNIFSRLIDVIGSGAKSAWKSYTDSENLDAAHDVAETAVQNTAAAAMAVAMAGEGPAAAIPAAAAGTFLGTAVVKGIDGSMYVLANAVEGPSAVALSYPDTPNAGPSDTDNCSEPADQTDSSSATPVVGEQMVVTVGEEPGAKSTPDDADVVVAKPMEITLSGSPNESGNTDGPDVAIDLPGEGEVQGDASDAVSEDAASDVSPYQDEPLLRVEDLERLGWTPIVSSDADANTDAGAGAGADDTGSGAPANKGSLYGPDRHESGNRPIDPEVSDWIKYDPTAPGFVQIVPGGQPDSDDGQPDNADAPAEAAWPDDVQWLFEADTTTDDDGGYGSFYGGSVPPVGPEFFLPGWTPEDAAAPSSQQVDDDGTLASSAYDIGLLPFDPGSQSDGDGAYDDGGHHCDGVNFGTVLSGMGLNPLDSGWEPEEDGALPMGE